MNDPTIRMRNVMLKFFLMGVLLFGGLGLSGCSTPAAVRGDVGAFAREPVPQVVGPDYRIGVPDRVAVRCERLPELGLPDVVVSADGTVDVPLLGRVEVAGLTADEASELLSRRAGVLLEGVDVTLEVTRYASRHVYVFGALSSVGPVAWRPGLRLVDVLNETVPTPEAATSRVDVIRPAEDASGVRRVTVDAGRLLSEGDAGVNVVLMPGDVVHVPLAKGQALAWSPLLPMPQGAMAVTEAGAKPEETEIDSTDTAETTLATADENDIKSAPQESAQVETFEVSATRAVQADDAPRYVGQAAAADRGPQVVWIGVPVLVEQVGRARSAESGETNHAGVDSASRDVQSATLLGEGYFGVAERSSGAVAGVDDGGVVFWD